MENTNPPPTSNRPVLPAALCAQAVQELHDDRINMCLFCVSVFIISLIKIKDQDMTMEEYVQYETEKALSNSKVYNWKAVTYGKISLDSGFSSEPMVSSHHFDEVNLKIETSVSEYDDEEYNVISYNDLFPFNISSVNDSKLDMDNDDDKIDIK
nr:hypothetical protein [Tanacetum cinerariifolium]